MADLADLNVGQINRGVKGTSLLGTVSHLARIRVFAVFALKSSLRCRHLGTRVIG
jgi:hypothetical protein